jgi:ribosomal protein S18 acetylase RimI-like enzyme
MIKLRAMRNDEFSDYRRYSALAYGQDLADNYGYDIETALNIADRKLDDSFPNGVEASEQRLLCIEFGTNDASQLVGYLWYNIIESNKVAFIYDFYVFDGFRGCGIGTQVFGELERTLKDSGIEFINLRVAKNNDGAKRLYERLAFSVTGYNMSKNISDT